MRVRSATWNARFKRASRAPGVPAALKPAVGGYCTIITAMVAVALGTSIATGDLRFGGGAVMRAAQLVLVSTLA